MNRFVEWDDEGIWHEADQRHVEIVVKKLGLTCSYKGVVIPGMRRDEDTGDEAELHKEDATANRGLVARATYLAQDRSDIVCGSGVEQSHGQSHRR